jgi:hypothetical protein
MVEGTAFVRNPLTIVAFFAGIAEISGTIVLPHIAERNQSTFVWFLMIFPIYLVSLFFATLNFNHKALYAPSDFRDEENFFKSLRSASPAERKAKLKEEAQQIEGRLTVQQPEPKSGVPVRVSLAQIRWAEELAVDKIARELGGDIQREVLFGGDKGRRFVFDGVVRTPEGIVAIEVQYLSEPKIEPEMFRSKVLRIIAAQQILPDAVRSKFSLIIAFVLDSAATNSDNLVEEAYHIIGVIPFPAQVRLFSLSDLEDELESS